MQSEHDAGLDAPDTLEYLPSTHAVHDELLDSPAVTEYAQRDSNRASVSKGKERFNLAHQRKSCMNYHYLVASRRVHVSCAQFFL
jgi:hypothetical protein